MEPVAAAAPPPAEAPPEAAPTPADSLSAAAGAAAAERLNKRLDPRKEQELQRLSGSPPSEASPSGGGAPAGGSGIGDRLGGYAMPESEDDYYGLRETPRDSVDTSAFQPSHILAFEIPPGDSAEFFQEIEAADMRKVVRGDWFVTRCVGQARQVSQPAPTHPL